MTWVGYLGWVVLVLTWLDRRFHSQRRWWAPVFGIVIQLPWCIYALALGWDGVPVAVLALLIMYEYRRNWHKWIRTKGLGRTEVE